MLAKLYSVTLEGIRGTVCEVEVDVSRAGFDKPMIVGLPDAAVKESIERVRSAVTNSGYKFPDTQSLVNLAPADIKKVGPAFDLPIALGMLAASGSLESENLKRYLIVGELALDGRVRPVNGVLSMAMTAVANGFSSIIVPIDNAREAAVVQNINVYGVSSLSQATGFLSGELPLEATSVDIDQIFNVASNYDVDFADVKGQESVKRALTIAAAGGHNIMMIGPPGAGKTLLSARLATVMPPLTLEESLETTQVYSSVGMLDKNSALVATRPVRTPHHTASGPSLIGGGTIPRPGELSMAHHGILFLDEFAEFPRNILEMIRQPLEDGTVTVSRAKGTVTFPARFILVAAMNPCPCGYHGTSARKCKCTPNQIERYISKISGPLVDRIDIHIDVPPVTFMKLRSKRSGTSSADIKKLVMRARQTQTLRFGDGRLATNSTMSHKEVETHCVLDTESELLLKHAMIEFALSARAHDKICKVARTIADIEGESSIKPEHIAEAVSYRKLDREL
ncbi:MAG TPA: ATP-binding protein [Phycisphaerales bacterium]|nr:ATP-binding protein [Phycisphaerales bacterium]